MQRDVAEFCLIGSKYRESKGYNKYKYDEDVIFHAAQYSTQSR